MSVRRLRKDGVWSIDVTVGGRRIRRRSPIDSRAGAKAYESKVRAQLAEGIDPLHPLDPGVPETAPLFSEYAPEWLESYARINNKYSEYCTKESNLRVHLLPAFGHLRLDQFSVRAIEQFKLRQLKRGLSPKTVNNHLVTLRKALREARDLEIIETVPRIKPIPGVQSVRLDYLSFKEADQLLADQEERRWNTMVHLALRTGLRLGELRALKGTDFDFERAQVAVERSIFRGVVSSTKNHLIRHIPISDTLLHQVRRLLAGRTGWLFTRDLSLDPVTEHAAQSALKRMYKRRGLRHTTWHLLRHTFASHLAQRGVPLYTIQKLLGHTTPEMTQRYAHLAPTTLRDAVRMLDIDPRDEDNKRESVGA